MTWLAILNFSTFSLLIPSDLGDWLSLDGAGLLINQLAPLPGDDLLLGPALSVEGVRGPSGAKVSTIATSSTSEAGSQGYE